MNMQLMKKSRRYLLSVTTTAVLGVVISGSALALPNDASGTLDRTGEGPRLSPDTCFASFSVNAMGHSNVPVLFRLRRDGELVAENGGNTNWFQANNGTFQFQPGTYKLNAINQNPDRPARITMSLFCS